MQRHRELVAASALGTVLTIQLAVAWAGEGGFDKPDAWFGCAETRFQRRIG